jgi:O-antigen biosynthesis protein
VSSTSDDTAGPRDGIEAAIFEVFQELVGRIPDRAERAEWSAKIARGVPIRELRTALQSSGERDVFRVLGDEIRAVADSGLFDAAWYQERYPDVKEAALDPVRHYVEHGWEEDRAPNPWFDPAWYRETHELQPRANLLIHYLTTGEAAGLRPSRNFDPAWYRATYPLDSRRPALADFLQRRTTNEVAPSAAMWPALGLPSPRLTATADDVFLSIGDQPADWLVLRETGLFDDNYYALHSGDVLSSGSDMLLHYCQYGWRENRQPNFYFDSHWYCATNPEVQTLDVNPLAHYLLVGEPEGRRPIVFFDPLWYQNQYEISEDISPLAHFLAHRREGTVSPNEFFDPVWYAAQRGETLRSGRDPFARFLVTGLTENFSPSEKFDLPAYRKKNMGRVSKHFRHLMDPAKQNPLVRYLLSTYK